MVFKEIKLINENLIDVLMKIVLAECQTLIMITVMRTDALVHKALRN